MTVLKWLALIGWVVIGSLAIILLWILIFVFFIGQCIGERVNARLHS